MKLSKIFNKGNANWDKLCNFMEENEFTCADFLACVCANIKDYPQKEFKTEIMVAGKKFKINIKED